MATRKALRPSLATVIVVLAALATTAVGGYLVLRQTLGKQPDGSYLVPTNQIVSPVGKLHLTELSRPKDTALSPDRNRVAVLCTDKVLVFDREGEVLATVSHRAGALGICWTADGTAVLASGQDGKVDVIGRKDGKWAVQRSIQVDETGKEPGKAGNPQVLGLATTADGKTLYVALGIRNAVAEVDLESGEIKRSFKVGAAPHRLLLLQDQGQLVVANRGGEPAKPGEKSASSAGTQIAIDPISDGAARGSVSIIDLKNGEVRSVVVGKHPNDMVYAPQAKRLYVAESDADTIGILDLDKGRRVGQIQLRPHQDTGFGMMPNGLALSKDEKTLYAACGGANAVAMVRLDRKPKVEGYIPSGWYPIAMVADEKGLVVACSKGIGSRPSSKTTRFGVHDSVGLVQFVEFAKITNPFDLTQRVVSNNRWEAEPQARPGRKPVPVPERIGEPSVFKHVVYIIKENLTYDLVLGDMKEGNGDASICVFGEDVTPNHHRLAKQFVLLDNTYTSGTNSADGHQWTSSAICNGYQEQNYSANQRSYPYDGGDPLACSPKGFLWTAVNRKGLSVRVYGEYVNNPKIVDRETGKTPTFFEFWEDYKKNGNRYKVTAETDNAALRPFLHPTCIGFPSIVPDQWRADRFLEEFDQFEKTDSLPSLCMLLLPNNHTSGTSEFYPTPRAMVADNDLALGRIVDRISHSKYWKDTLILVIEDDSQTGVDHVDGHRTAAFCISPYTRRGQVVSEPYNHTSVVRTIELVLGVPSMNRFDQSATPLTACFQEEPNFAPYYCAPNRIPLDERNAKKTTLRGEARDIAQMCEQFDWSQYDSQSPITISKAIWYSQRPNEPFPMAKYWDVVDDDDE